MNMRKFNLTCILLLIMIFALSCSISAERPDDGIWYCEELAISIDFSLVQDDPYHCAALHNQDGTSLTLACLFDYGNGITVFKEAENEGEKSTNLLIGAFEWDGDEFRVTTHDGDVTYIFIKTEL